MPTSIFNYLEEHINTKRASTSKRLPITKGMKCDQDLLVLAEYKLSFEYQYFGDKLSPTEIKLGMIGSKVCIRIDERHRNDRARFKDYFADDIECMKKLVQHLRRVIKDYERTQYFLRAQLIPSLFFELKKLLISYQLTKNSRSTLDA